MPLPKQGLSGYEDHGLWSNQGLRSHSSFTRILSLDHWGGTQVGEGVMKSAYERLGSYTLTGLLPWVTEMYVCHRPPPLSPHLRERT